MILSYKSTLYVPLEFVLEIEISSKKHKFLQRQYGRTPHRDSSSEEETTNRRGSIAPAGLSSEEDSDDDTRKRSRHASQDSVSSGMESTIFDFNSILRAHSNGTYRNEK